VANSLRAPATDKLILLYASGSQPLAAFAIASYLQPEHILSRGRANRVTPYPRPRR
jgi:hypothetical protein